MSSFLKKLSAAFTPSGTSQTSSPFHAFQVVQFDNACPFDVEIKFSGSDSPLVVPAKTMLEKVVPIEHREKLLINLAGYKRCMFCNATIEGPTALSVHDEEKVSKAQQQSLAHLGSPSLLDPHAPLLVIDVHCRQMNFFNTSTATTPRASAIIRLGMEENCFTASIAFLATVKLSMTS